MTDVVDLFDIQYLWNLLAVLWFLLCWVGYTRYASWKARDTACLASVLHLYREDWMRRLLLRDNRVADASVIGNLERNASFFASSTLIIIAGVLTLLGSAERTLSVLNDLPFVMPPTRGLSELKLLCLAVLFVYAFFTFSWCSISADFFIIFFQHCQIFTRLTMQKNTMNTTRISSQKENPSYLNSPSSIPSPT